MLARQNSLLEHVYSMSGLTDSTSARGAASAAEPAGGVPRAAAVPEGSRTDVEAQPKAWWLTDEVQVCGPQMD